MISSLILEHTYPVGFWVKASEVAPVVGVAVL